jgi:hypothetical protein
MVYRIFFALFLIAISAQIGITYTNLSYPTENNHNEVSDDIMDDGNEPFTFDIPYEFLFIPDDTEEVDDTTAEIDKDLYFPDTERVAVNGNADETFSILPVCDYYTRSPPVNSEKIGFSNIILPVSAIYNSYSCVYCSINPDFSLANHIKNIKNTKFWWVL